MTAESPDAARPPFFPLIVDSLRVPGKPPGDRVDPATVRQVVLQERPYFGRDAGRDGKRDEAAQLSVLRVEGRAWVVLSVAARYPADKGRTGRDGPQFLDDGWYLEMRSMRPHPVGSQTTQDPFTFAMPVQGAGAIAFGVIDNTGLAATLRLTIPDGTTFEDPFRNRSALLFVRLPSPESYAGYGRISILDAEGQEMHAGRLGLDESPPAGGPLYQRPKGQRGPTT